jgi:hypothetical protein
MRTNLTRALLHGVSDCKSHGCQKQRHPEMPSNHISAALDLARNNFVID